MTPDPGLSVHKERAEARQEFNRAEIRKLRYLHRRLMFLETKAREDDERRRVGVPHNALEAEALEWVLTDIGFLEEKK